MGEIKYRRYIKASIFKRFTAFLGDLFLIVLGIMLVSSVVSPFTTSSEKYKTAREEYAQLCLDSHLYQEKDGKIVSIEENIDQALVDFYTIYDQEYSKNDTYINIKKDSNLFEFDSTNNVYIEVGSEEEMKNFYLLQLYNAQNLYDGFDNVVGYVNIFNIYGMISFVVSFSIPVIIFLYVIPLCNKGKSTLGKRFVGLTYVTDRTMNHQVGKLAYTLNFFVFGLISLIGTGILLLVNAFFIFLNERGQSFCDYTTGLILVDKNQFFSASQKVSDISLPYQAEEGYLDELS